MGRLNQGSFVNICDITKWYLPVLTVHPLIHYSTLSSLTPRCSRCLFFWKKSLGRALTEILTSRGGGGEAFLPCILSCETKPSSELTSMHFSDVIQRNKIKTHPSERKKKNPPPQKKKKKKKKKKK